MPSSPTTVRRGDASVDEGPEQRHPLLVGHEHDGARTERGHLGDLVGEDDRAGVVVDQRRVDPTRRQRADQTTTDAHPVVVAAGNHRDGPRLVGRHLRSLLGEVVGDE